MKSIIFLVLCQMYGIIAFPQPSKVATSVPKFHVRSNLALPDAVDWRSSGGVTPVKYESMCASDWAFAATGAVESQVAIKTGKMVSLSEQNLVDCTRSLGNNGCFGGEAENAFIYMQHYGIESEETYVYSGNDQACTFNPNNVVLNITTYVSIKPNSESDLMDAVANVGPVAAKIDGDENEFMVFRGENVYSPTNCDNTLDKLNHYVLIVGYGTQNNQDYWLIKNSWGSSWGSGGYMKLIRDGNNHCGIATKPSYPQL